MTTNSKKTISLIIIISIILTPFASFVPKVNAANSSSSVSGYISGLAPVIAQLPGCKAAMGNSIKKLFSSSSGSDNLSDSDSEITAALDYSKTAEDNAPTDDSTGTSSSTLTNTLSGSTDIANSIPVHDQALLDGLKAQGVDIKSIQKSTAATDLNQNCLNAIGKSIVKLIIRQMSLSIINWIQGKNSDGPLFVTNPSKFFGDIAKKEILNFGLEINDPTNYPFGKSFMQNLATSYNNKFADNAKYSLNTLISETNPSCTDKNGNSTSCDIAFNNDFSQGGWGAWEAMTQVPANNPLGFQLMASNELSSRLSGTNQSTAQDTRDALNWGNGISGDVRCVQPYGVTKQQDDAYAKGDTVNGKKCYDWEYVTPGTLIASQLTAAVGYNDHALLDAQTLNDAIATIADAAISKFSNNLITNGLTNLSTDSSNYGYDTSSISSITSNSQTQNDYSSAQISTSTWLQQNPNFNIRTDLNQALIDIQRTYVNKLTEQNKEIASTANNATYTINPTTHVSNAYGLIPTIYQLDYCIPGPHPGWKDDSRTVLNAAENAIVDKTEKQMTNVTLDQVTDITASSSAAIGAAVGGAVGSIIPGLGTAIGAGVGAALGALTGVLIRSIRKWTTTSTEKIAMLYGDIFRRTTGIKPDLDGAQQKKKGNIPRSKQDVINILDTLFSRYTDAVDALYAKHMPLVTDEAATKYQEISGYSEMLNSNNKKIDAMNGITTRLETIKISVDQLKSNLQSGQIDQNTYDSKLSPLLSSFANISVNMVSGDDVANADNMTKQIIDEKNYIYNDLLKGPNGCEQDLLCANGGDACHLPWIISDTKRMTYPAPILYDYNGFSQNGVLPDPFNSGYTNNMPKGTVNDIGPGFLSWYNFEPAGGYCSQQPQVQPPEYSQTECISVNDLLDIDSATSSVGQRPNPDPSDTASSYDGLFEHVIGIY